jgi:hypothetical protein
MTIARPMRWAAATPNAATMSISLYVTQNGAEKRCDDVHGGTLDSA